MAFFMAALLTVAEGCKQPHVHQHVNGETKRTPTYSGILLSLKEEERLLSLEGEGNITQP